MCAAYTAGLNLSIKLVNYTKIVSSNKAVNSSSVVNDLMVFNKTGQQNQGGQDTKKVNNTKVVKNTKMFDDTKEVKFYISYVLYKGPSIYYVSNILGGWVLPNAYNCLYTGWVGLNKCLHKIFGKENSTKYIPKTTLIRDNQFGRKIGQKCNELQIK